MLFKILLANYSAIKIKVYKEMVISSATLSSGIRLTVAGDMAAGLCRSPNFITAQATAAIIRQPQIKFFVLGFTAPDEERAISTFPN